MTTQGAHEPRNGGGLEFELACLENAAQKPNSPSITDPETAASNSQEHDQEHENEQTPADWNWDDDPYNPYNWPNKKKLLQLFMLSTAAFTA